MATDRVNFVLLLNAEARFGQTYCQKLDQYIDDRFEVIAAFGNWQAEGGWAWNHGTKILKRISNEL